jgi:pantoate--beta-alanine ligase
MAIQIIRDPAAMRARSRRLRAQGLRLAFVPTMGALHAGHASLLRRARRAGDRVVLSIFVNPLQFGPHEDYRAYPRDERRDLALARRAGADLVYIPDAAAMYPDGFRTSVAVEGLADRMCGALRPGHFTGVATVVLKLLHQVEPDALLLGQKDAQQAILIGRMMRDLDVPVRLLVCPTVREPDGLAMSSRNAYLAPAERAQAPAIYAALRAGVAALRAGERSAVAIRRAIRARLARAPLLRPEYVVLVDLRDLLPHDRVPLDVLIAVAARLGRARLIDNVIVRLGGARHRARHDERHPTR